MITVILGVAGAAKASAAGREENPDLRLPLPEGAAHGFPSLRNANGGRRADGEFVQTPEGDRLNVRLTYDFGPDHRIVEVTQVRQRPSLAQEEWSWEETEAGQIVRRFAVDFATGKATVEKNDGGQRRRWNETLKIEPGRTFAGFAFTLAIECLRPRLVRGEQIELQAVGFTPKPRNVRVQVSYGGLDQMVMGGRRVTGDRFVIHPRIPAIAELFIAAPDTRIWLTHPVPAGFLRWEGSLAEPKDEVVRVDLLPGDTSGPAQPIDARLRENDPEKNRSR